MDRSAMLELWETFSGSFWDWRRGRSLGQPAILWKENERGLSRAVNLVIEPTSRLTRFRFIKMLCAARR
jgi:hypothetical protein